MLVLNPVLVSAVKICEESLEVAAVKREQESAKGDWERTVRLDQEVRQIPETEQRLRANGACQCRRILRKVSRMPPANENKRREGKLWNKAVRLDARVRQLQKTKLTPEECKK